MDKNKGWGIGLCVLAGLLAIVAVKNPFITPAIPVGDESGLGVSQMVGSFLPALLALIFGVRLLSKPAQ